MIKNSKKNHKIPNIRNAISKSLWSQGKQSYLIAESSYTTQIMSASRFLSRQARKELLNLPKLRPYCTIYILCLLNKSQLISEGKWNFLRISALVWIKSIKSRYFIILYEKWWLICIIMWHYFLDFTHLKTLKFPSETNWPLPSIIYGNQLFSADATNVQKLYLCCPWQKITLKSIFFSLKNKIWNE